MVLLCCKCLNRRPPRTVSAGSSTDEVYSTTIVKLARLLYNALNIHFRRTSERLFVDVYADLYCPSRVKGSVSGEQNFQQF